MSSNKFLFQLAAEITASVNNNFDDNYDQYRYGEKAAEKKEGFSLKSMLNARLNKSNYFNDFNNKAFSKKIEDINYPLNDFMFLYNILEDEYSKKLLVKIVAFRILGYKKIKLPLSTPQFWENQRLIEANQSKDDFINIPFMNFKLPLTDLNFLGVPVKLYYLALGINIDFIIKQYELHRGNINIEAEKGSIIIDAGGCFGDTALYFANKAGKDGGVHVFEFIPDNISVLKKNISLNPDLTEIIELVPNPVWSSSGKDVFYTANGPASKVSMDEYAGYTGSTKTLSIDDYCNSKNLERVDFIKMDIEGAEIEALKGAKNVIVKFKPTLAVALYHSTEDFDRIPRFINDLGLGYKFYLSHATIHEEETMLFAVIEK